MTNQQKVAAIIAAAGSSQRMGGVDKIFLPLAGKPLLTHVIDIFQKCTVVDQIVLVLNESNMERGRGLVEEGGFSKVVEVCPGGKRRAPRPRCSLPARVDPDEPGRLV